MRRLFRAVERQPVVAVEETDDASLFEGGLPGVKRGDITVEIRDRAPWITGEMKRRNTPA